MNDYCADATGPVRAHSWTRGLRGLGRQNGLVDGPFAKRPRPGNHRHIASDPCLHPFSSPLPSPLLNLPPKPSRLQALLEATLAAEPSAVS